MIGMIFFLDQEILFYHNHHKNQRSILYISNSLLIFSIL